MDEPKKYGKQSKIYIFFPLKRLRRPQKCQKSPNLDLKKRIPARVAKLTQIYRHIQSQIGTGILVCKIQIGDLKKNLLKMASLEYVYELYLI